MYLLLFGLWILLNGRLNAEIFCFGLGITALIALAMKALYGYGPRRELRLLRKLPLAIVYLAVLLWEIFKAASGVLKVILFPHYELRPTLVDIRVDLRTEFAKYVLANSITLTPGTISVETRGDVMTVHCLDGSMLENTEKGIFVRLLRRMEA
ncbi:MAG: Na+/H+ antiporter subunit E [Oscillospiraceae bacterium]|nr:Na+/H+ antiporter subunit E [Oscillospiraceae bacterium]